MWVLTDINGNIFGTAGLEIYGHKGLLRSVAVRKNLSNSDYGTYLVNHVIDEARRSGVHELFLLTTTAPVFFRKLGFKDDRKRVAGSITNSAEFKSSCPRTAILMRFSLR
jgi:amino-acid N-acetyltransferase